MFKLYTEKKVIHTSIFFFFKKVFKDFYVQFAKWKDPSMFQKFFV